jgi:hypothetical protein
VGFKTFVSGEILTASDVNAFVSNQQIAVFVDAAARDASIASPVHGQHAYLTGVNVLTFFDGSDWVVF